MLKDLKLSQQAADESNMATPMGEHAANLYQAMVDGDGADTDFSGMINFLQNMKRG